MKSTILLFTAFLFISLLSCGGGETVRVATKAGSPGKKIILEVVPGPEWTHLFLGVKGAGIMTPPQFVIWAEDTVGNLLDTLYVTGKYAYQSWMSAEERPSTVPYWGFKMAGKDAKKPYAPSKYKPLDTISSATPQAGFVLESVVPETADGIVVLGEFNVSLDFNEFYQNYLSPDDIYYSGKNGDGGQPAIVYHALLLPEDGTNWVQLALAGHSSPSGADGGLYTNLAGLTTGLGMIKSIQVRYAE